MVALRWGSTERSAEAFVLTFPQRGLPETKPRVLSKELDKCHHPFCEKHRNSDENTFFRNSLPRPFHPEGDLLFRLLDGTSEPNTWNQFAGLRRGYWSSQHVYTWKILLFNSTCGWFSPHATLSLATWVRSTKAPCFIEVFRGIEKCWTWV